MSKNIKIAMNENKNINELKEMMRKEYAKNMASLMEYCTEQQQEEEKIGEEIILKEESMSQLLATYEFLQTAEKKLMKDIKKANITVRNFPQTVSEIRNKTKIKEGGELYLFFTTIGEEERTCIVCKKI